MVPTIVSTPNAPDAPPVSSEASQHPSQCAHCGTELKRKRQGTGNSAFCCVGCETVYQWLRNGGLEGYYDLDPALNIPIPQAAPDSDVRFLDQPEIRSQWIDFEDAHAATVRFTVPHIHCAACVWLLEHLYQLDERIGETRVNLLTKELQIRFDPSLLLSDLVTRLHQLGYPPDLQRSRRSRHNLNEQAAPHRTQLLRLGIAGFGFGNIMLLSVPHYLGLDAATSSPTLTWLPVLLTLPILAYSADGFWRNAYRSLRQKHLNIEVPITLGLIALTGESLYQTITAMGPGYWDSLSGLVFFLLAGQWFKQRHLDHLAFDQSFQDFFPLSSQRLQGTRCEVVPIAELQPGDRIRVRHQELVPADATLLSPQANLDYSFVTGESEPTAAHSNKVVYAGARNLGQAIDLKVSKPVSESYLTTLWNHEAFQTPGQQSLQTITDRVSQYFTPTVLTIALLSALAGWELGARQAIQAFASVLIVACPCALALAGPFSLGTALRQLAQRGVHVKNTESIEGLAQISTIIFDKTGTLTYAGLQSPHFHGAPLSPQDRGRLATLTQHSLHPLARQLSDEHSDEAPTESISDFTETAGAGLRGCIGGVTILCGSPHWLESHGVDIPPERPSSSRHPRTYLAIDGDYRGYFQFQSEYRPGLQKLVHALRSRFRLMLASGDTNRDEPILRSVFGKNAQFKFGQSPYDKLELIEERQNRGERALFVGDGLNDAGALQIAHVGVAVTEDSAQFSPSSDVILDAKALNRLPQILSYARSIVGLTWICIAISFAYNAIGITWAATGQLSPLLAAILMPLSSVTIVSLSVSASKALARRLLLPLAG